LRLEKVVDDDDGDDNGDDDGDDDDDDTTHYLPREDDPGIRRWGMEVRLQ